MKRSRILFGVSVAAALFGLTYCTSKIDPNKGTYACATAKDCGPGYECHAQDSLLTGYCFKAGSCTAEICDGLDNDCNGIIDDGFDFTSDPSNCGTCGAVCTAGTTCLDGYCAETLCADGVDNNGNGVVDCQDIDCSGADCDPANPALNCGRLPGDGGEDDEGTLGCVPRETACNDQLDNDGDGLYDCGDPDCEGKVCDDAATVCAFGSCEP